MYLIISLSSSALFLVIIYHLLLINKHRRYSCHIQLELCTTLLNLVKQDVITVNYNLPFVKLHSTKFESVVIDYSVFENRLQDLRERVQEFTVSKQLLDDIITLRNELREFGSICYSINSIYKRIKVSKEESIKMYTVDIPILIKSIQDNVLSNDIVHPAAVVLLREFEKICNQVNNITFDINSFCIDWVEMKNTLALLQFRLTSIQTSLLLYV